MTIEVGPARVDGLLETEWDVLLKIIADIEILIDSATVYSERDFCVVEFAAALASWVSSVSERGPSFVYTSLESDVEGLVLFTNMKMDQWSLACRDLAGVERKGTRPLSTVELKAAAIQFVDQLRQKLLLDITPLQPHHLVDLRATIERLLMRR